MRIAVVIPTFNRSTLVPRAVRSALAQTLSDIEVIVVIDGPDPATCSVLTDIDDSRLRVIELPTKRGGSGARNAGVLAAQAEWVAFLDDDDEWLPQKLEQQWAIAITSTYPYPIVACVLMMQNSRGQSPVPRRLPNENESVSEYLFARQGLFHGEGFFITSMLFTSRKLLLEVPFTEGLTLLQDVDWLLRASQQPGVNLTYVPTPLGTWYVDDNRQRVSTAATWQRSLDWLQNSQRQGLITPTAYAAFILTQISSQAAPERDWQVFWLLLKEAYTNGRPKPIYYPLFLSMWLMPPGLRRHLRDFLLKLIRPMKRFRVRKN